MHWRLLAWGAGSWQHCCDNQCFAIAPCDSNAVAEHLKMLQETQVVPQVQVLSDAHGELVSTVSSGGFLASPVH